MRRYLYIISLISLIMKPWLNGQEPGFIVEKAPFSSVLNDEFAPVFYGEGLVFCSNMRDNSLIGYRDDRNRLYKIFYSPLNGSRNKIRLLSKDLTSYLNDGPVTFNKDMNVIYYSRNNNAGNYLGNISDTTNKLGIYRAELINGTWTGITPFEYNDPAYSVSMPSLDPDGTRIYFSSDMPGGYGGLDIYFCNRLDTGWDKPENLGPVINTAENETFPFAFYYNKLYFSSEGHEGRGGKDIYYTQEINGSWISPVAMDPTINSPADDFGIVFDSTLEKGYFSSNRGRNDDIYSFKTPPVDFTSCDTITENNYCFVFYDDRLQPGDTVQGTYVWDFGEGVRRNGTEVIHCFPGQGEYNISLTIFDTITGDTLSEQVFYLIKTQAVEQAYISSYNSAVADNPVHFNGLDVNLTGFNITDYYWNFGDGFIPGGPVMNKAFRKNGIYTVRMGLLGEKDTSGVIQKKCYEKKIRIFDSSQEFEPKDRRSNEIKGPIDSQSDNISFGTKVFFMDDLSGGQKTRLRTSLNMQGEQTLGFLKNGILTESSLILDNLIEILKENQEVRLELVLHTYEDTIPAIKMNLSEICAQEISRYFENRNISADSFDCRGMGASGSVLKPLLPENKTMEGVIEILFMEKNSR